MTISSLGGGSGDDRTLNRSVMCPVEQRNARERRGPRRSGHITGAGTLHGQSPGWQADLPFGGRLPAIVLSSAASCLWKSFRRSRTPFRDRPETVRLHPGSGVHLHPGILFEIIPEHRSESYRNRVHLAPDSPRYRGHHYFVATPAVITRFVVR